MNKAVVNRVVLYQWPVLYCLHCSDPICF